MGQTTKNTIVGSWHKMKVRQDAWSHEDDLLLAETVLRHIREGSTQLNAFEEVGDRLNRTSAACGFRWNAEVRKKFQQAMELAKKQRKERKRALAKQEAQQLNTEQTKKQTVPVETNTNFNHEVPSTSSIATYNYSNNIENQEVTRQTDTKEKMATEIDIETVISYLYSIKNTGINSHILRSENERLTRENKLLLEEKEKLTRKLQRIQEENSIIEEDYQALVQIMDRARRMVSLSDESMSPPQFFPTNHESDFGQIAK